MRKTVQSLVLMLALSAPVYAGVMQCPITSEPPPPPSAAHEELTADNAGETEESDGFTETVLTLLKTALSLL